MGLKTTCLGAYPKPDWLPLRDWFQVEKGHTTAGSQVTKLYTETSTETDEEFEKLLDKGPVLPLPIRSTAVSTSSPTASSAARTTFTTTAVT